MITTEERIRPSELETGTGWKLTPEGACKGDLCIPLRGVTADRDGSFDLSELAEAMGLPLVHDPEEGVWALGPESIGGRALSTAEAPDLELPDLDGKLFRLSSLRGQKIVVYAWAPY